MYKKHFKVNQNDLLRSFFDNTVEYWDNIYAGKNFINIHMKERKTIVLNLLDEFSCGKKLKILDIGCGTGIITKSLVNEGHLVAGIDVSEKMLTKLKVFKGVHKDTFLGQVVGDAEKIPFSEKSFDAILCIGVLQYQLRNDHIFEKISRTLKKGGFCIFTIPNLLRMNYLFDPFYCVRFIKRLIKISITPEHTSSTICSVRRGFTGDFRTGKPYNKKYFLWELKNIIFQNGLEIKRVVGFGFGPITLMKKKFIHDSFSIKISEKLNRLAQKYYLKILKVVANRWVFVVQKK